ncbi:Oxidoreductase family protein [Raphidiopsis brookii D9]|nr:Oxidoreductase family protein [Raphidiopsis brookii D9]
MGGKLKVGIAGYGIIGKVRHKYSNLHPKLEVVAVCDRSFAEAGKFDDGVRFYPDFDSLIKESIDILFVCLPNYLAPTVTIAGLERGLHVFCEKPPGRNVDDIRAVIECEKRHPDQRLMYGFNHRYHDSVQEALRIIQSGELGKVLDLRGVYGKSKIIRFDTNEWRTQRDKAGGGILLDQGIHMVDMMRLFAGEFSDVYSFVKNDFWHHDVEDNAYVLMRTYSGIVAMLHSSATQWRHRFQLDITLGRGAIMLSGILTNSRSYGAETITVVYADENDGGDPREQMTRFNIDHSWPDEISSFVDCIVEQKPVASGSSWDAYKTMELVEQIYHADKEWNARFIMHPENFTDQPDKSANK